jgi:hypothetical protein
MKRLLVTLALALVTSPSFAAIQYEFKQKNTTDDEVQPTTEITARAIVDGPRSRVEFLSGNLYPPGTYMIATEGARRMFFIDPVKEWYSEVNTAGLATTLGASNIRIENFKTSVQSLPDTQTIAGIVGQHHRVTMSYDMTLTLKDMPLKQHVRTEIDSWTTDRFGTIDQNFLTTCFRTGNPDVDQIIDAETSQVEGFPLRQVVTIRTSYDLPIKSNLKTPTTRVITRETWVTKIVETQAAASLFVVPATYRPAAQPNVAPESSTTVLSFDPPAGGTN